MTGDLDDLAEKIRKIKGEDPETIARKVTEADEAQSKQGIQAGIELVGAIAIPTAIGYGLDNWLDTKPAFMLVLFFLGVCTGFYNVYRISQNMGTAVGNKPSQNGLQDDKKKS